MSSSWRWHTGTEPAPVARAGAEVVRDRLRRVDKTGAGLGSSVVPNSHHLEEQWSSNRFADMSSWPRASVS